MKCLRCGPAMTDLVDQIDARGKAMSPSLPEDCKNYLIDIDGTVCEDIPNEEAEVFEGVVEVINGWFDEGHIITFFTSRTDEHAEVSEAWLDKNGFKYHGVLYNKPRGGNYHWVDNHTVRATRFTSKFTEFVKRWAEVEVFDDDEI
jgi:uncharacterized HAD superfamily protein